MRLHKVTEVGDIAGHGGKPLVERVMADSGEARKKIKGLKEVPINRQIATETISICYGFFSPLEGFMARADVESVCKKMTLTDGTLWSIPIVFDISNREIADYNLSEGDTVLLTFTGNPLAVFEIRDVFAYDTREMAQDVYGTQDEKHPGVKRTLAHKDKFLGGRVTLVNPPKVREPFTSYFLTPREHRERFREKGWQRIVAHQTRNVPHTGHEWLMKHAWMATHGDLSMEETEGGQAITGILVNCITGEKRSGDYIDEAMVLAHDALRRFGYFREDIHTVSLTFWDMRYAGPKEAIHHAIIRTNLGLTHHMFGRDHAGVGSYYHPYDAHRIFSKIQPGSLRITPIFVLEWLYCPVCGEVTSIGLCGHRKDRQSFSGTFIRSIIMDGVRPTRLIFRPEIFDIVTECADKYGFGSPFVTREYLERAAPAFTVEPL